MPEPANEGAEGADDEATTEEVAEETNGTEPVIEEKDGKFFIDGEEFDPARAMKTIKAQREKEKELEQELKPFRDAAQAEADKNKTLEQKLEEREARIQALEAQQAANTVRRDFEAKAKELFVDTELAFLAAEKEALLGAYDPETGNVGEHNLDKLAEKYPALAGKAGGTDGTGNAGNRMAGKPTSVNEQFNSIARGGR